MSDERIWIRLPNWLGDAMMSRPLLHALRRSRPAALLLATGAAPLLALLGEERMFDAVEAWPAEGAARARVVERVRAWHPTTALILPPSFSSAFAAWRSGARRRIGFAAGLRSPLLTDAVRRAPRGDLHLSEEYATLGARLGIAATAVPVLPVTAADREDAAAVRARLNCGSGRYVVLGPGAIYGPAKRWAAGRFAELGSRLLRRGFDVVVCGSAAERAIADEVISGLAGAAGAGSGTASNLVGQTSLGALASLCAGASLAVCNDSGLAHLAAAVGAPTLVVFGSTSSGWTAPLGRRVRVLQHATPCAPCFQRSCSIGYRCLDRVGVDEAETAALELAQSRSVA